jgi:hypothetical protein
MRRDFWEEFFVGFSCKKEPWLLVFGGILGKKGLAVGFWWNFGKEGSGCWLLVFDGILGRVFCFKRKDF